MKRKYPHLHLLPKKEIPELSWDVPKAPTHSATEDAIRHQMDCLRALSNAVFISVLLLEIAVLEFSGLIYETFGFGGTIVLILIGTVLGLAGALLMYFMAKVDENVRCELQHVSSENKEAAYV